MRELQRFRSMNSISRHEERKIRSGSTKTAYLSLELHNNRGGNASARRLSESAFENVSRELGIVAEFLSQMVAATGNIGRPTKQNMCMLSRF